MQTFKNDTKKTLYNKQGHNGEEKLVLENFKFPSYDEIVGEIREKAGERPMLPEDLPSGAWTEQSLRVLEERYLLRDEEGKVIETPEELCWRVAWEMASVEVRWGKQRNEIIHLAKTFYRLLVSREFLPNSPTLMNAGTGNNLQYSGCYVLPVEDSMVGIFDGLKYQALIHKSGGGTGFSFSRLRQRGSIVGTSRGIASGPVSFMRIYDAATNEVKQGGKRRGANMGILRIDHPDIKEFIHCKEEGGITNFNISVAITDVFMEAYYRDENYDLIDPKTKEKVGELNAREVFDEIVEGAWKTGDPGLVFIDKINRGDANPVPSLGPIESTNPCGEQPLYPFDACNLGSIFLTYFVKEENGVKEVDWEKLRKVTRLSTRFLDNVIEANPYPLDEIRQTVLATRRIGLGVGGWADMLIELGIPYDSEEALVLAKKVMETVEEEAVNESRKMAKKRGPFPMWPVSIYQDEAPRRNSTVTTIAPTGTISIIANASSGIEPLFAIAFKHKVQDQHLSRELTFVNPVFERKAREEGFWTKELEEKIAERGLVRDLKEVPEEIGRIFGTAHDVDFEWHIRMQDAFQQNTENAVSKTINLPHEATKEDIKKAYLLAWETNCKGITVFRDGSKDVQVLNLGTKDKKEKEEIKNDGPLMEERPFAARGTTYRLKTPVGAAFITINEDINGEPLEVFINVGKAGSDVTAMAEALGRTISTSLRLRGGLSARERAGEVAQQLAGIGGRRTVGFGPKKILSLPDAIASALSTHLGIKVNGNGVHKTNGENGQSEVKSYLAEAAMEANGSVYPEEPFKGLHDHTVASAEFESISEKEPYDLFAQVTPGDICPECGSGALVYEEGCSKCHACGHSEC